MARLENWYMVRDSEHGYRLAGNVREHINMEDGTFIFTTPIIDMIRQGELFRVNTRNTEYRVNLVDMKIGDELKLPEKAEGTIESIAAYFFVICGLVAEFFRDENEEGFKNNLSGDEVKKYREYLMLLGHKASDELKYFINLKKNVLKQGGEQLKLQDREILIGLNSENSGFFSNGFYELNGKEHILEQPVVQNGMTQHSVLFADDNKKYDLRAFMLHKKLKVYHWWGIMTKIYFENTGTDNIEIEWGKENLVIEPRQTRSIELS